jgi:hypothetical protein
MGSGGSAVNCEGVDMTIALFDTPADIVCGNHSVFKRWRVDAESKPAWSNSMLARTSKLYMVSGKPPTTSLLRCLLAQCLWERGLERYDFTDGIINEL